MYPGSRMLFGSGQSLAWAGVSQVLLIQPGSEYWQRGGVFRLGFSPHRPILISEGVGGQEDWKLKLDWLLKVVGSDDKLKMKWFTKPFLYFLCLFCCKVKPLCSVS